MRPYEIRQMRDGRIDYNNFYARPVSLTTPEIRRFCRQAAAPKKLLLVAATVSALMLFLAALPNTRTACAQCAPSSTALPVRS